eukprot:1092248-Pyramimonas_sp.AAC.1
MYGQCNMSSRSGKPHDILKVKRKMLDGRPTVLNITHLVSALLSHAPSDSCGPRCTWRVRWHGRPPLQDRPLPPVPARGQNISEIRDLLM